MDEPANVQVLMPPGFIPQPMSMLDLAPMVGSNVMVGYKESELLPKNMGAYGSRLGGAQLGTEMSSIVEKCKGHVYANLV